MPAHARPCPPRSIPAGAGEPPIRRRMFISIGSIPAGAGEPHRAFGRKWDGMVYPRGCGGTTSESDGVPTARGLSPRVRGNPTVTSCRPSSMGLSPRVRGNPRCVPLSRGMAGSIPAGAGEPGTSFTLNVHRLVYPRGCGGTVAGAVVGDRYRGLSPRVRGNPPGAAREYADGGSIPAGAGEPTLPDDLGGRWRVYPRGCGGTARWGNTYRT